MNSDGKRRAGLGATVLLAAAAMLGTVQSTPASAEENQVFFRGGLAQAASDRQREVFTDAFGFTTLNAGGTGWYIGAGLDLGMKKDFFGVKGMSLVGELGLELKRFASNTVTSAVPSTCAAAGIGTCSVRRATVQITMLTVDVAPKLKFREGHKLRPWIIPVGMDFHVISPPSNESNYLDIGTQHGVGIEYNVWGPLNLGIDGRYHFAANMTNTENSFGTVGMYLGLLY